MACLHPPRENDPATELTQTLPSQTSGPWRLHSIETEGFGGLNKWSGPAFTFSFDGESLLAEGPNGSGKSSLIGAIIWALCGKRPRDQANDPAENQMPVFGTNGNPVGDWPPIACYPPTAGDLTNQPYVRAALTFCNESNDTAIIERTLDGEAITERVDPQLAIPSALLEAGILMPARLSELRLDEKKGPLGDAVQKLTGLDDLVAIGALIAAKIEHELNHRQGIATCLAPLKQLGSLAQTIARETIEGLSDRMSELLEKTLLTEQFQFHSTQLNTKKAVVVRGTLSDELHIDATLVANTSWLRAVLWAFIFCLREEAVEQIGSDPFPLFVFDDPQATFDGAHRHRWAQYISSLQNSPSKAQIILTTHDEMFLQSIKISGMSGREAMIAPICSPLNHVGIFEGASLDRAWTSAKLANTDSDGHDYIAKVRVYVEGLLRLMLRGEDPNVLAVAQGSTVGKSREKITQLRDKGIVPWNRSAFTSLANALEQNRTPIQHMEQSHHSSGNTLGMAEAIDVEQHWRKELGPKLTTAFRLAREYHHLHGGLSALYAPQPTVALPEGYKAEVRTIPLLRKGRVAALTDGRIADGRLDMDEFQNSENNRITLAQHSAFRLIAQPLSLSRLRATSCSSKNRTSQNPGHLLLP